MNELSWPFKALNETLFPMSGGDLIVIGGSQASGKTTLMLNMALKVAREGRPVAFLSLERFRKDFKARLLQRYFEIDLVHKENQRMITREETQELFNRTVELNRLPLEIRDVSYCDIEGIAEQIAGLYYSEETEVFFVDYLQLIDGQDVACRVLKEVAEELEVVVVLSSLLPRASRLHQDGIPQVEDFSNRGIEDYADTILLLHRPGADSKESKEVRVITARDSCVDISYMNLLSFDWAKCVVEEWEG